MCVWIVIRVYIFSVCCRVRFICVGISDLTALDIVVQELLFYLF